MLLVELATQGVKGFSTQSRAVFKAGYNIAAPPPGLPPTLCALVSALLYNDGRGGDAELAAGTGAARAGLTLVGKDGRTYRLLRQLGGAGSLHRLESGNNWTLLSQDSQEMNQALRSALGLPTKGQFDELFAFTASSLPSKRRPPEKKPEVAAAPAPTPTPSQGPGLLGRNALIEHAMAASKKPKLDAEGMRARIEQLKAERDQAREVEELQYKLEGMNQQIDACEQKLRQLDKLVEGAEAARKAAQGGHSLKSLGLPENGRELVARYDDALVRLKENIRKLQEEDFNVQERAPTKVMPLYKWQQFQIGAGAGVVFLAAGMAMRGGAGRYLALLDIPSFGFAALTALKWIGELQGFESFGRKSALTKDRVDKLQLAFDNEFFQVKAGLKLTGLDTGKELLVVLDQREAVQQQLRDAEAALNAAKANPELLQALDDQDRLAVEAKALEAKISEMGALTQAGRHWRDVEFEIEELEQALVMGEGGSGSAPAMAVGGSFSPVPAAPAGKEDPTPKLLALAQDLFNVGLDALGPMLKDRAGQYLLALSDKRYTAVAIDAKGHATVAAPGRNVAAVQLDDRDLDLLYLSVRLTIVEKLAATGKLTVLLDEPFAGFDDAKLQLFSRMLKHIASMTQVVHATALPSHRPFADAAAAL